MYNARTGKNINDKKCNKCTLSIDEDINHILKVCPYYSQIRNKYDIFMDVKELFILRQNNKDFQEKSSNFLSEIYDQRFSTKV